ncbi:MAG: glycosyltransferase family 2 protein [Acidimicrobiales bacterium]
MPADALPVYLVHHDAPDWVRSSVASILRSDTPVAVTVVDNGPPQDLGLPAEVRVLATGRNTGYAGAANAAITDWLSGDAAYAVVGAHDLHVEPDTLRALVDAAESEPRAGVVAPTLSTNAVGQAVGTQGALDLRAWVSGTCLLLRRSCIEAVGGFDELFGSYGEDDELCWRVRRAGWLVARVPGATGHGLGSGAGRRRRRLQYRNFVLLAYRTRGLRGALRIQAGHVHMTAIALGRRDWPEVRDRVDGMAVGTVKVARAVRGRRRRRALGTAIPTAAIGRHPYPRVPPSSRLPRLRRQRRWTSRGRATGAE